MGPLGMGRSRCHLSVQRSPSPSGWAKAAAAGSSRSARPPPRRSCATSANASTTLVQRNANCVAGPSRQAVRSRRTRALTADGEPSAPASRASGSTGCVTPPPRWLADGGSESGLMAIAGWTRTDMLIRYTRAPRLRTRRRRSPPPQSRSNLRGLSLIGAENASRCGHLSWWSRLLVTRCVTASRSRVDPGDEGLQREHPRRPAAPPWLRVARLSG